VTLIEQYHEAISKAQDARWIAERARPDEAHGSYAYIDKLGLKVTIKDAYYGTFGTSGVGPWSDDLIHAFAVQVMKDVRLLLDRTATRLEAEAEEARLAAREEARAVLKEVL
jgi:hypothetical protein